MENSWTDEERTTFKQSVDFRVQKSANIEYHVLAYKKDNLWFHVLIIKNGDDLKRIVKETYTNKIPFTLEEIFEYTSHLDEVTIKK